MRPGSKLPNYKNKDIAEAILVKEYDKPGLFRGWKTPIYLLIGIVGFLLLVSSFGCSTMKNKGAMTYSKKTYKDLEGKNIFTEILFPVKDTVKIDSLETE